MSPLSDVRRDAVAELPAWVMPLAAAVLLIPLQLYSHPLFHILVELFAVGVAMLAAVVGWKTWPFTRNDFVMYLACGYFWIGGLDLLHALTYRGMEVFPRDLAAASIQVWVGTRYLEALLLASAPLFVQHRLARRRAFLGYGAAAVGVAASIFAGVFPTAFVPGEGLTPFKVWSEYVIIAVLALALLHLWAQRDRLDSELVRLTAASIVLTALAEWVFTTYAAIGEWQTYLGHVLKLASFWLIYLGVVRLTLTRPFRVLSRGAYSFDAVPDATVLVDRHGIVRQANRAAWKVSDIDPVGQRCHALFHDRHVDPANCPVCRRLDVADRGDLTIELSDPERILWVTLAPIEGPGGVAGSVHVYRDVTERHRLEQELAHHRDRLEELVETRTRAMQSTLRELESVSYSIAHDLRAPLRAINGFGHLLEAECGADMNDTCRGHVQRMRTAAVRMSELIDGLLGLTAVVRHDLARAPVDLGALAHATVEALQARDPARSVDIEIAPDLTAYGDPRLLRLLLDNLLANAWKFTTATTGARIAFGREECDGGPTYFVSDNGAGFDMRFAHTLFEPFRRLHGADEFDGAGIGLATVRRIVERHGGTVRAEGEPGKGAKFTFTLPERRRPDVT